MTENEIGKIIVNAAIAIHKELGPGLLESVYELVLAAELEGCGLAVQRQQSIPINFKGREFKEGFRADILVENKVIIEMKSIEKINNSHKKQLLTYLRLSGKKLGFLLNFGDVLMKDGIIRTVNNL